MISVQHVDCAGVGLGAEVERGAAEGAGIDGITGNGVVESKRAGGALAVEENMRRGNIGSAQEIGVGGWGIGEEAGGPVAVLVPVALGAVEGPLADFAAEDETGVEACAGGGGGEVEVEFKQDRFACRIAHAGEVEDVVGEIGLGGGDGGEGFIDHGDVLAQDLEVEAGETRAGDDGIGEADDEIVAGVEAGGGPGGRGGGFVFSGGVGGGCGTEFDDAEHTADSAEGGRNGRSGGGK